MARSADRNNSFALTPSRGAQAAPMLMPRRGCVEKPISYGFDILSMMRRAHDAASSAESAGSNATNSSPPTRHTKSSSRTLSRKRPATAMRTASPAACPNLSFTSLKPSRSRQNTANCACLLVDRIAPLSNVETFPFHYPVWKAGEQIVVSQSKIFLFSLVQAKQDFVIFAQDQN